MTDEYKRQILDYITNLLNRTKPDNSEVFLEQEEISKDKWEEIIPDSYMKVRFEDMIAGNELTTNLSVLYGGYYLTSSIQYGIIVLVDENFNPVKAILEYDSGTKLRYIQRMKQAEDGTFYLVDDEVFTPDKITQAKTSQKRFVMTNNFTVKNQLVNDYQIVLRTSYIFSGNYVNFYCRDMYKDPNSAHYIFFGHTNDNTWRYLRIFGLKVNVGMANEWTMFSNDSTNMFFGGAIALFQEDNVKYRCLVSKNVQGNNQVLLYSKTYTGSPTSSTLFTFPNYSGFIDSYNYEKQCVFTDYDNVYLVRNNQKWGNAGTTETKVISLYKYSFGTNALLRIYEKNLGQYDFCDLEAIYLDKCGAHLYIQYNTNIGDRKADYYFQRLVNDEWKPILIGTQKNFMASQRSMYIKCNFNLLQVYLYSILPLDPAWFQYLIKEDYNPLNYNGTPYIDYDALISEKGQIYSNNKIVFARDLYNKNINNNVTVSTIQVPNNYLNDINLDLKKLISKTNFNICNEENLTNKNIYEMLFVNYINTINVIDEDTEETYPEVANYINYNINVGTKANCESTFIGKAKINYSNNTYITQNITWHWNTDHYEVSFAIDTTDIPTSIEYISYDGTMTYLTKQLDLEQNKCYIIKQKLRIE